MPAILRAGSRPVVASTSAAARLPVSVVLRPVSGVLSTSSKCKCGCGARRCVSRRAADTEAPPSVLENFSFSDAKKANEYSTSDVQQALAFYQDGEVRAWACA